MKQELVPIRELNLDKNVTLEIVFRRRPHQPLNVVYLQSIKSTQQVCHLVMAEGEGGFTLRPVSIGSGTLCRPL